MDTTSSIAAFRGPETTAQRLCRLWRQRSKFVPRRPAAFSGQEEIMLPVPDFVLLTPAEFAERHRIAERDVEKLVETGKISTAKLESGVYISVPIADHDLFRLIKGGVA
jgi:hypothetical protein